MRIETIVSEFVVLASIVAFASAGTVHSQSTNLVTEATQELAADASIIREFRIGEKHNYQVVLTVGDYLKLKVSQKSIDVAVSLHGPKGEKLADSNVRAGPEQIFWIASASGSHRIEITSKRRCDPGDKGACAGLYELSLIGPRKSSAEDIQRFQLQDLIRAARPVGLVWEEASALRLSRIEKLKEVSQLAQSLGETAVSANSEEEMGYAYLLETEGGKSVEHYEKSRSLWRSAGEVSSEIRLLLQLGFSYNFLGEMQRGFDSTTEALELGRISGDKRSEINVRFVLATRLLGLNEPRRALLQYEELLRLSHEMKYDDFGALTGMARVYDRLREPENATKRRREAIASIYAAGYAADDWLMYYGLARLHGELGEHEKEAEFYKKEYELSKTTGSPFEQIAPLANIGNAYFNGGDYSKALDYLHRALAISRQSAHRAYLSAQLGSLGDVYLASGDPTKAIEYYIESASLINKDLSRETASAFKLARAYRAAGDSTKALAIAQKLIATVESQRANILSAELSRSFFSGAQRYYLFYIDLLMQLHKQDPSAGHAGIALNLVERAKARSLIESLKTARADITKGVDPKLLLEEELIRRRLNDAGNRQTRLLTTKFTTEQLDSLEKEIGSLTDKLSQVQTRIKRTSTSYAAITQPQPLTANEIQNELLDNETVLLEYLLGNERSYLWMVTAKSVQAYELPKREEIEAAARAVYSLLNDSKRWSSDSKISAEYNIASAKLSETILGPVANEITGKRLIIVADGALQYVPFSALPRPNGKMAGRKEKSSFVPIAVGNDIVSLPSASTLAVLRRESANRKRAQNGVAIIADPVFSENDERLITTNSAHPKKSDDLTQMALERAFSFAGEADSPLSVPRLPFTRREAESIFDSAPKNSSLKALDFEASREVILKSDLSKYRIVHFATHGILHSEHPELSGIVLSLVNKKGEPVNGFLRLNEIYNMNLNADLVVLSACQTALGKEIKGEGLIGLTRGFMYAGSPRVVASLWKVDDVATAELMKIFYQKMLKEKMRPAAALRAAKVAMYKTKRWNAPYYWAAFELQGEWR